MLELWQELVSLERWDDAGFEYATQIEIDAVAHRILRVAELLRKVREIPERN